MLALGARARGARAAAAPLPASGRGWASASLGGGGAPRASLPAAARRVALAVASAGAVFACRPAELAARLASSFGGSGGGHFGGGGGAGGGGGGGSWFGAPAALAASNLYDDDDEGDAPAAAEGGEAQPPGGEEEPGGDDDQTFLCAGVRAANLPTGPGIPTQRELFDGLNCQGGAMVSRKQLSEDLSSLLSTGLFQNVDANVTPSGGGYTVEFAFREKVWPPMMKFEVSGSTILPPTVESEVLAEARKSKYTTVRVLAAAKNIVEGYYQERGLTFGTISHFDGMETGQVVAHIIEGEISRVSLVYVNPKDGTTSPQGSTRPGVVLRELPFVPGSLYNVEDAKRALRDVFALQLFDNVQVVPRPDEGDPSKVEVDVVLRERPLRTAELELEWGIGPGEGGRPDLVSLTPGGSVFFEHRNLQQEGRQLYGSVSTSNFLAPQDDLGFKVEYVRPYARGEADPRRTALKVAAFNSRKLSPVFTGGPLSDEAPGVWVDRAGAKAALVEQHGRQSRLTYGVALAEVSTRDESGAVCSAGAKALPSGQLDADGPPTTHSGTGTDRLLLGQANLTRDTTYFLNGVLVGARDILTLDVCPGTGSGFPFFNRHSASATRFLALAPTHRRSAAPPPVLVLHARYGGCAGSLASYDAFTLGGPHSCRGYAVGELGASRRVGEAAAELRLPLPGTRTHGFAFVEAVSDLGSSPEVAGNPTAYYRRAGGGACAGVGLKLGATRVEWVSDRNARQGAFYVRFGERF